MVARKSRQNPFARFGEPTSGRPKQNARRMNSRGRPAQPSGPHPAALQPERGKLYVTSKRWRPAAAFSAPAKPSCRHSRALYAKEKTKTTAPLVPCSPDRRRMPTTPGESAEQPLPLARGLNAGPVCCRTLWIRCGCGKIKAVFTFAPDAEITHAFLSLGKLEFRRRICGFDKKARGRISLARFVFALPWFASRAAD